MVREAWNKSEALVCPVCSTEFHRSPSKRRGDRPPTCSRQCRGKLYADVLAAQAPLGAKGWTIGPPRNKGADNPAWKGGVTLKRPKGNYKGVRYVRCPPEFLPMARKDGYIMEHRLVMAQWVGRMLTRQECVNHIDRNPSNNQRSNLELYPTNADHKRGEAGRFVEGVANRWCPKDSVLL